MGRRKIEIKPIRDDRNRSVTFLKRKGGLFKKAHELSVLCQVDVAVIIFGHNKKAYEYSSHNIEEIIHRFQYFGGAHEHKGPQDFQDKGGADDDDDDEEGGDDVEQRGTPQPEQHMIGIQQHPGFQHVRQVTPQGSPQMHNGAMPQYQQRVPSPLPPGGSRPSSRADQHQGHIRRVSSNLVPPQHQQAPIPQQNYAYQPNPPYYNPAATAQMQRPPGPPGPPPQPQGSTYPPPFISQTGQHPQMQQVLMHDNRRSSMPAFTPMPPQQANMQSQDHLQAPQHSQSHPSPRLQQQQHPQRATPSPRPTQQHFTSPPIPQPRPLPAHAKSQSMFTPIDDSRSMLAQHWGPTSSAEPALKQEAPGPRSVSVDVAAMQREKAAARANGSPPQTLHARQAHSSPQSPGRSASTPSAGHSRTNTSQPDAKRPRLKVQIPSEQSDGEGATGSAQDDTATAQPKDAAGGDKQQSRVVLPPPSPSAGAQLSAGPQGPVNPFARPAPPMSTNPHAVNRDANHIETPISALPSRFMSDSLLPSPSTFYPEWGFGRSGNDSAGANMLPSPLNFQTPVVGTGSGWREEDRREQEKKRATDEEAGGSDAKKPRV